MRVATLGLEVRLGACDEETASLVQAVQSLEVEVAAIHHVIGTSLWQQQVECIDIVHLAVGDVNKARNVAAQIQQSVQLDGRLGRTKRCPRKDREAQIDGRGIERVDRLRQIHSEGFLGIQAARDTN